MTIVMRVTLYKAWVRLHDLQAMQQNLLPDLTQHPRVVIRGVLLCATG